MWLCLSMHLFNLYYFVFLLDDNNEVINCCNEDGSFQEVPADATLCYPIKIPSNDPFLKERCISFVRSVCTLNLDCSPGPIEQVRWGPPASVRGHPQSKQHKCGYFKAFIAIHMPCPPQTLSFLYRKDTEPLYHAFMYSPITLLSIIFVVYYLLLQLLQLL